MSLPASPPTRSRRTRRAVAYRDTGLCYCSTTLINFSEAVFAIAATIGVANISKVPSTAYVLDAVDFIKTHVYRFLATFITFQLVARARGRHVKVYSAVERIDDTVVALNALHLILVTLLPFAIGAVADFR